MAIYSIRISLANGTFLIGAYDEMQCQTSNPDCTGILSANLADLNIWSRAFTSQEMFRFTSCDEFPNGFGDGDILSWNQANWTFINNVFDYDTSLEEICQEKEESFMAFPEMRTYREIYDFCLSMGAEMSSPKTPTELQALMNVTNQFFDKVLSLLLQLSMIYNDKKFQGCKSFFLGWNDEHSEGIFADENARLSTDSNLVPLPDEMNQFWSYGEPNGGRFESCAEIKKDGLYDQSYCLESLINNEHLYFV